MNNNENYTIKSQEALQYAIELSRSNNNQAIECVHLLKGIMKAGESLTSYIFSQLEIKEEILSASLDKLIDSLPKVTGGNPYLSSNASEALRKAGSYASSMKDEFITLEHMLLGILSINDNASSLLKDSGMTKESLKKSITALRKGSKVNSQTAEETYNSLARYAINLNERARSGKLDPVIGRDDEIRRILQILTRRSKNNPILIGEPGVGKTAIVEGLAHRIIRGDVPEDIKSKIIYSLDMGALIAGAKYKGEFEERLKSVVNEVIASDGSVVLFIDEIHTLVGAGKSEGAMDAANILKPALARGDLRAIGATTLNEYQKYFEKDKALERRFQVVMVEEPDRADSVSILRGLREKYEAHHKVIIRDEAIISAVDLSYRYITDRFLPDKAIDLIDEAASRLRLEMNSVPEEIDEVERTIRRLEIEREALRRDGDNVKVQEITEELKHLQSSSDELKTTWQAEKQMLDQLQKRKDELEEVRSEAESAERSGDYGRVAEIRYGRIPELEKAIESLMEGITRKREKGALIREDVRSEDIAEIVAKWTGIPVARMLESERDKLVRLEEELQKRIVGQDEAVAVVSDAVRRSRAGLQDEKRPVGSFIFLGSTGVGKTELARALADFLFNDENLLTRIDMSEYQERHSVSRLIGAPPGYVGYDEGGQLTEAVRHKPYSVVLLDEIEKAHPDVFNLLLQVLDDGRLTDNKGRVVNFRNVIIIMTSNLGSEIISTMIERYPDDSETRDRETVGELNRMLRKVLRPEFINRIDDVVVFNPLQPEHIKQIAAMQMERVVEYLDAGQVEMSFTGNLVSWLATKGYDHQFGARPVKRVIQKMVVNELSRQIISGQVTKNSRIIADVENDSVVFRNA
jgi:ATP-dependent Clp protease ATP-binding subunit ClpB